MNKHFIRAAALAVSMGMLATAAAQSTGQNKNVTQKQAVRFASPERNQILAATMAGGRVVVVGDRGVVMISDDQGVTFRQAKSVPTRATLTSVSFVDNKHGWAVGHWGVVLNTQDGGETWQLQRDDLASDQPLFAVWFKDRQNGFAAGLFSLLITTHDGGKTWVRSKLPAVSGNKASDVNLFGIFPDRKGNVLLTGEQGLIYRSRDSGAAWEVMQTGARGTFWTGRVLDDDSIVVAGLRGNVYRSKDDGASWARVEVASKSSLTDMAQLPNGDLVIVGMDGVTLVSKDRAGSFAVTHRADQSALTAVLPNSNGVPLIFSQSGIVKSK